MKNRHKPQGEIDLSVLTVEGVRQGISQARFSAESLARHCFEQIDMYHASYNAVVFLNHAALNDAREIDRRRAAGETLGPLAGVPVVVKDTIDVAGFPTTAGWSLLYGKAGGVDLIPDSDAPVVQRLRAAGAILLGKTNVPVMSHSGTHANDSWAGPTYNVVMRDRAPGGSSAGTASAIASAMAVLGLGEETGGSIQNPASAQDLVGIKPTIGLVSNCGVLPMSSSRDVVGPIARNVRDAAHCLDVLAGYSPDQPEPLARAGRRATHSYAADLSSDALVGKRVGLYGPGWRTELLSGEATLLYERAKLELRSAGAILVDDPFAGSGFSKLRKPTPPSRSFDARGLESFPCDLENYLRRLGPNSALKGFADFIAVTAEQDPFRATGPLACLNALPRFSKAVAEPSAPADLSDFNELRDRYLGIFDGVMTANRLDALVFPQMLCELPPLHGTDTIKGTTVSEINIAGLPGVTVPAGYYASGAPFGLIFVGRQWDEKVLISLAYAYEQATHHRNRPTLWRPR
ncbi:amidase [Caballeronia sp. LZ008]|uniref:amidase n=1 Tax=unclassified Caballeronia TaxID=2646786 RepID=UPI0020276F9E|nr:MULTISPECIES: amidase [unclassified Caballeronia]MDR5798166.1 amidase [Caballeronia sp. LZ008]